MPDDNDKRSPNPTFSGQTSLGAYLALSGWDGLLKYPKLKNEWAFFPSPNNKYWGPSNRLRRVLESFAHIYEIPFSVPGLLTYQQGIVRGMTPPQVNVYNGKVTENFFNGIRAIPGDISYGSQLYGQNGQWVRQFDGVNERRSVFGPTITNTEIKGGASDAYEQARLQKEQFGIPKKYATSLRAKGIPSHDGRTILIDHAARDAIRNGRYWSKMGMLGGSWLGLVGAPFDIYDGMQSYREGPEQFAKWSLTSGPTYMGSGGGLASGLWRRLSWPGIIRSGLKGGVIGGAIELVPLSYYGAKEYAKLHSPLALLGKVEPYNPYWQSAQSAHAFDQNGEYDNDLETVSQMRWHRAQKQFSVPKMWPGDHVSEPIGFTNINELAGAEWLPDWVERYMGPVHSASDDYLDVGSDDSGDDVIDAPFERPPTFADRWGR